MDDYLVRVVSAEGGLRGLACRTSVLAATACRRHNTSPTASACLARALTGGALMGALLKDDQRTALKFEGNGPIRTIVVEANGVGEVRGYVGEPSVTVPLKEGRIDVAAALGSAGLLTVVKDLGLKEPYGGTVHLVSGEIGEDLAYYLTASEQIPSAVGLGVYVEQDGSIGTAGGFLIQALPPSKEGNVESIVDMIGRMGSLTRFLREGGTPEALLERLFAEVPYETLTTSPLAFGCRCSRKRFERGLLTLGVEQLRELQRGDEPLEVVCEFCDRRYRFEGKELDRLIDEAARS
jgi:molecular chaperone Hsp33